jgi:hypothetical protein
VQKAESSSAVHLPLDHFEPVNLAFDLTVTPRTFDGGADCPYISLEPECKTHQRSETGKLSNLNPVTHLLSISTGDSGPEIQCQAPDPFEVRTIGRELVK